MMAAAETVRLLAEQIRQLETTLRPYAPRIIPLGDGLRPLFPDDGLATGSLVELFSSAAGAGAWTLALTLARYACGEQKTLFIADPECCFYPPAGGKLGLNLERTVIVRPRGVKDAMIALAQALRCPAVGTAIGTFDRLSDRDGRRLQLSAEAGGAIGILLRPMAALDAPSFAMVRMRLDPLPASPRGRRLRLEMLRCRGFSPVVAEAEKAAFSGVPLPGSGEKEACLEIDHDTGHVRLLSPLELAAHSA